MRYIFGFFVLVFLFCGVRDLDHVRSTNEAMLKDTCAWENYQSINDQISTSNGDSTGYPVFAVITECQ